eukprot:2683593-Ditylum_brightwellii.AAC.1
MFVGLYLSQFKKSSPPELYPLGTEITFCYTDGVCIQGLAMSVPVDNPTSKSISAPQHFYTIRLDLTTFHSSQLVLPSWIGDSNKVTLEFDRKCHLGHLLVDDGKWKFNSSTLKNAVDLLNFALIYKLLLDQQLIHSGWQSNFIPEAAAAHISTSGLACDYPDSLIKALAPTFADQAIWHKSYIEELNSLLKLGTFHKISIEEYR